jgi:capsular polysaccharide export protein
MSAHPNPRVVAASRAIARTPAVRALFGGGGVRWCPPGFAAPRGATVLGWGRKRSGRRAQHLAARAGGRAVLLEDGFLRGLYPRDAPLSLVLDDVGIYYDAAAPSRLEALIAQPLTPAQEARAQALAALWREGGLSKHTAAPDPVAPPPAPYVLVVDQVRGDASIAGAGAGPGDFAEMLRAARAEHPDKTILIKAHPAGRGHFPKAIPGAHVVSGAVHPARLVAGAAAVYTVSSQLGFEALLHGVPVACFGAAFFAGWGVTDDRAPTPTRRTQASLAQLVHGALIAYPRYVHPESGAECEAEDVAQHLALQRRMRARFGPGPFAAQNFSPWKRPILRRFMAGARVTFRRAAQKDAQIIIWGDAPAPPDAARVLRVEDGFLRSAGLGAALTTPLSWCCDDLGLHYDPARPSRLEDILQNAAPSADDLARARALIARILAAGVTKYTLTGAPFARPPGAARVVLAVGQVPGDAALRHAATGPVRGNADLLRAVRGAEGAQAHIIYKPHPDVVAGLRAPDAPDATALADTVLTGGDMAQILGQVDALHTISSLAGLEALLRGVPVTCWGAPFYAGWGLTDDRAPVPERRTRRLTIEGLAHGALIAYPTYISRATGRYTTPERAVDEIAAWRDAPGDGRAARLARQVARAVRQGFMRATRPLRERPVGRT